MGVIGRNCLAEGYREEGTFPEENILPEVELVTEVFVREETTSLVYVESSFLSHAEWFDARSTSASERCCGKSADAVVGGNEIGHKGCEEVTEWGDGVYRVAADDVDTFASRSAVGSHG